MDEQAASEDTRDQEWALRDGLMALQAVGNELSLAPNTAELCRRAVELGRSRLGFDRLALWFTTQEPDVVEGSFGVDEDGHIRDERGSKVTIRPGSPASRVLRGEAPSVALADAPLRNDRGEVVGTGTRVVASLWNGRTVIGYLAADNLLTREEITASQQELLKLYASTLGHLCSLKQTEAALRDSEKHLRTVIASAPVILWELDREGIVTFAEGAGANSTGIPAEEVIGRHVVEIAPRIDDFDDRMRRLMGGESITTTEEVGDTITESRQSPLRDAEGNIIGVIGVSYDITDRIRAEHALRDSEERYRTLVEELPIAVIRTPLDDNARLLMANPAAARMLGYDSVEELLNCTPQDLCDDPQLRRRMMQELIETGQVVDFECRLKNKDGSPVWASMTAKIIRDAQGKPVYIDCLSLDVTERKRAEFALQAAHAKLVNAREKERRRLAGDLHDSIGQRLVALQLLLASAAHDPTIRRDAALAQRLVAGSQNCRDLIREVRDICHGLYPPTLESLGLVSALEPLVQRCRAADVSASVSCPAGLQTRRFAPDVEIALFRIAQEAVNNALRHGHARQIQIDLHLEDADVNLTITDDGAGFDTSAVTGQGLGLTMMREWANAAGGELTVESTPASTTVRVRLPVAGAGDGLANPPAAE